MNADGSLKAEAAGASCGAGDGVVGTAAGGLEAGAGAAGMAGVLGAGVDGVLADDWGGLGCAGDGERQRAEN